ncbi:MAG: hypothetical protein HC822_23270 [Oscillochloris sp.]|nr:hypothetical protein [Oscillochloris sp.]
MKTQTKGLSHADSLAQLPVRANCMNWLIGHILANRNSVLRLLDAAPAVDPERLQIYQHESEPVGATTPEIWQLDETYA